MWRKGFFFAEYNPTLIARLNRAYFHRFVGLVFNQVFDVDFEICQRICLFVHRMFVSEEVICIFLFLYSDLFFVCYFQCLVYELLPFFLSVRSGLSPDFCLSQSVGIDVSLVSVFNFR